jgi:protein O-mannosyl-transferase
MAIDRRNREFIRAAAIAAALVGLVALVYGSVGSHEFVNFDDGEYVYENGQVLAGLTPSGIAWAFTTGYAANWHPLTWVSHMADVSLFGSAPGAHHLVNAALHAANAVLLFAALRALTGASWRSAAVAALFAVHPLNVQSVAWVSERKNVLSTLFWLLAMLAYAAYARRPSPRRMGLVAGLLALGLLCKAMLVSLPLVLLALDYWPLGRFARNDGEAGVRALERLRALLVEKVPLFVLVALSSVVTWLVQSKELATASVAAYPLLDRVANAAISYGRYLRDAAWPSALSCFYPHPRSVGEPVAWGAAAAWSVALAALTHVAWRSRRRHPAFAVGWSWYLVTLVPVIGIVQVGSQERADRYVYVPLIGIFIAVVWGLFELSEPMRPRVPMRTAMITIVGIAIGALALRARAETDFWRDGGTLYGRAVRLDARNWLAWNNLGTFQLDRKDFAAALQCFDRSAAIKPDYADAHYNRGVALQALGLPFEAIPAYERALEIAPENGNAWVNVGIALAEVGRNPNAIACYGRALEIRPDDPHALYGLVLSYDTLGDRTRAFATLDRLRRVDPRMARSLIDPARGAR